VFNVGCKNDLVYINFRFIYNHSSIDTKWGQTSILPTDKKKQRRVWSLCCNWQQKNRIGNSIISYCEKFKRYLLVKC